MAKKKKEKLSKAKRPKRKFMKWIDGKKVIIEAKSEIEARKLLSKINKHNNGTKNT
jgi:hypothetical protein